MSRYNHIKVGDYVSFNACENDPEYNFAGSGYIESVCVRDDWYVVKVDGRENTYNIKRSEILSGPPNINAMELL